MWAIYLLGGQRISAMSVYVVYGGLPCIFSNAITVLLADVSRVCPGQVPSIGLRFNVPMWRSVSSTFTSKAPCPVGGFRDSR